MSRLWRAILTPVDGFITVGKTAKGVREALGNTGIRSS